MTHHNSNKKQKTSRHNDDSSHREYKSFDHSLIGDSLNLGHKNVAQIAYALSNGTQEVKDLLLNECNIIYECRLCKNMFRSFANLVAHKRIYCQGHQCEQMALYDASWFVPEQEKNDVKVEVSPEEPARNPTISFPPQLDSKTLELKRKSLHSIANSLQKDAHSDASDTKPISASQFYLNEKPRQFTNTDKTRKDADTTQPVTPQSLNKQTDSVKQTSIEESTLKTETSNQNSSGNSSGATILLVKSSTEDVINPSILNESSPNDRYKVEILDESQLSANSISPSKAKTMTPTTPVVCKKKHNRPNRQSILKRESPNVQKSPQISEMKPQDLKTVKPVWSGNHNSNAYGLFLNRHYHSNILPPSIPSKESSSVATSTSSCSSSTLANSNVHECPEQVCTKMQTKSKGISIETNQCNDHHERPINKTCIPIEVITIDSDNDDAYSDEIYAL